MVAEHGSLLITVIDNVSQANHNTNLTVGAARVVCSAATNYQIDHYVYSAGGGGEYGTMTCTYTQVEVYKES